MLDINRIRSDFPILDTTVHDAVLVYLDNAATTQKPRVVLDSILGFYSNSNSNIHRGVHRLSEQASAIYERARSTVKNFINASSTNEIIFTSGTTGSINLVADSFGRAFISEGDEIIISEMEHHSNLVPWQELCERHRAVLKVLPFGAEGTLDIDAVSSLITGRTKLLTLCHVSNALGVVNPVHDVIRIAHAADVPVLIDAAQAAPHLPLDVLDLDCDFLVFSGHKMYAGTGIGVLFGKQRYLEAMPPYQTGGGMIDNVSIDSTTYAELPLKFEAGTPNIVGAVSLASAIDYIHGIGINDILHHEQELMRYALHALSTVEDLQIYGPGEHHCGAVSFNLSGVHPYDAGMIVDRMGVAIRTGTHCAEPTMKHLGVTGTMRASFAMYNTQLEVDVLIEALRKARQLL